MTNPNKPTTGQITIRLPVSLIEQLDADAEANGWSRNAEINHRLRAGALISQLQQITADVAYIRTAVTDLGEKEN